MLESQSAMNIVMMQMVREMQQRHVQGPVQPSATPQPTTQQGGGQQPQTSAPREMKMDEKWIPSMPVPQWKQWNTRGKELSGCKDWLKKFCGWLCLIQDHYGPEIREAINAKYQIHPWRSPEQTMKSKIICCSRHFTGYSKIHGEEEYDEQEDHYEEGEPEGDEGESPEPEGEDPSG